MIQKQAEEKEEEQNKAEEMKKKVRSFIYYKFNHIYF
jgi:hypothetical protein